MKHILLTIILQIFIILNSFAQYECFSASDINGYWIRDKDDLIVEIIVSEEKAEIIDCGTDCLCQNYSDNRTKFKTISYNGANSWSSEQLLYRFNYSTPCTPKELFYVSVSMSLNSDRNVIETSRGDTWAKLNDDLATFFPANPCMSNDLPNLVPYQPEEWSDKIVVDNKTGSYSGSTNFTTNDNLYVDFSFFNNSDVDIDKQVNCNIYVDNNFWQQIQVSSLQAYYYQYWWDYGYGKLSAGNYTIKMVVDPNNTIEESNENDNEYSISITVTNATTSIDNIGNEKQISISPVPAMNVLTIKGLKNISELEIYSITGKLIKQQAVKNGTINISELKQGVYFVKIKNNGKVLTTQRIVKQ